MISVNKIKKQFRSNIVLNGVSLSVEAGEIYGLIGHNGAGKTTLMTIMAGLSKADSGKCIFSGNGISYLPDIPGFYGFFIKWGIITRKKIQNRVIKNGWIIGKYKNRIHVAWNATTFRNRSITSK